MMTDLQLLEPRDMIGEVLEELGSESPHYEKLNEAHSALCENLFRFGNGNEEGIAEALSAGLPAVVAKYGEGSLQAQNVQALIDELTI